MNGIGLGNPRPGFRGSRIGAAKDPQYNVCAKQSREGRGDSGEDRSAVLARSVVRACSSGYAVKPGSSSMGGNWRSIAHREFNEPSHVWCVLCACKYVEFSYHRPHTEPQANETFSPGRQADLRRCLGA
jgi:hypothetical protein